MITSVAEGFGWIESLTNLERGAPNRRAYRLERMSRLVEAFDHPERSFRSIHIAGSKGKSSTAAFLASLLSRAGFRVGRYTSPHVCDYRERIVCFPEAPSDELLLLLMRRLWRHLDTAHYPAGERPTTFELLTLLAWLTFQSLECSWAVVETGMGGRLDATNLLHPEACLITPIELEHTEYLGDTIPKIALEKAGIIKPSTPVFVGRLSSEALLPIEERATTLQSPLLQRAEVITASGKQATTEGTGLSLLLSGGRRLDGLQVGLLGAMQIDNAALAVAAATHLIPTLSDGAIRAGLAQTSLPGRFEQVCHRPPIIIDGAHTPHSVRMVIDAFRSLFHHTGNRNATLIFGCLLGKRYREMCDIVAPHFDEIIISRPGTFRPSDSAALTACFRRRHPNVRCIEPPVEALAAALASPPASTQHLTRPILITGSFYLAGEIREAAIARDNQRA